MPTIWTAVSSGAPDPDDADTAIAVIDQENAQRTAASAAQDPPVAPVLLPKGNGAQIKASIEIIMTKALNDLWIGRKQTVQKDERDITIAQKDAIIANLTRRRRAGETWDALVTDTAS